MVHEAEGPISMPDPDLGEAGPASANHLAGEAQSGSCKMLYARA